MPAWRRPSLLIGCVVFALGLAACAPSGGGAVPAPEFLEGVAFDAEHPNAPLGGGKADGYPLSYTVPNDLPQIHAPEIIVSLDQLTVHLFDRATGLSRVYPAGVGVKNSAGKSITPTGHFATGDDPAQGWWYVPRRWVPEYYGGFPFLRITATNSQGSATYGLHGPITDPLIRGYVSHGCIRMAKADIVELFYLVRDHASTPVTIQKEVELDPNGDEVDVGVSPALWSVGAPIDYGASVGPAPWPPILPPSPPTTPPVVVGDTGTAEALRDAGPPDGPSAADAGWVGAGLDGTGRDRAAAEDAVHTTSDAR